MLRYLERKHHLRHTRDGLRYVYEPTVPHAEAQKSALQHLVRTFFRGSRAGAMAALLDLPGGELSEADLERLSGLVRRARREGRCPMSLALDVLKAALLVALAWAVTRALARAPAVLRHDVWLLALIGALLVPVAEWLLPPVYFGLPDAVERWIAPSEGATGLALVLWTIGVAIWAVRVVPSLVLLRRIRARGEPWREPTVERALAEAARVAGVRRPITLLRSAEVQVPATWGVRRPVVALPAAAVSWSPERLRLVLLHELGHVRRQDVLVEMFLWLAQTVYWFHPAVWFAARRLRLERERACDEAVLATGARASDYCEHLVEIMRAATRPRRGAVVGATMAAPGTLEERVRAMLAGPAPVAAPWRLGAPLLLIGAVLIYAVGVAVPCIYADRGLAEPAPRVTLGPGVVET